MRFQLGVLCFTSLVFAKRRRILPPIYGENDLVASTKRFVNIGTRVVVVTISITAVTAVNVVCQFILLM